MIKYLEEKTNSHFLFIYNNLDEKDAIIDPNMVSEISKSIKDMNEYDSITLVLHTRGGNLASGYKIIEILKEKFKEINGIVIDRCGSTGTFMLLASDNIYSTNYSIITPTEPQLETYEEGNNIVSSSVIRNYLNSKDGLGKVEKLNPLTLGNYLATISYFKKLCYNTFKQDRVHNIIDFMLNKVDSHQTPLSKKDFEEMSIQLKDIPDDLYLILINEHNKIINYFKKDNRNKPYSIIHSKNNTSVYEKRYNEKRHKVAEGYFIIEEDFFMGSLKENGRVQDILEEKKVENTTYQDAATSHWDSYSDSRYHDNYNDRYDDYGDNSYYHDEYRDACLEKETPVVKKLVP